MQEFMLQSVVFCKGNFQKGPKSHEKLTQALQLRACQTLCNCAIQKQDDSSSNKQNDSFRRGPISHFMLYELYKR